ncbi:YD repeat protein, partial [mine drainage metagenome]
MKPADYGQSPQLATALPLDAVAAMAVDPEGGLYVATQGELVHINASGYVTLVAGGGSQPPASWSNADTLNLSCINALSVSPNNSLWFVCNHNSVWRLDTSNVLQQQYAASSGASIDSIAISNNGSVYLGGVSFDGGFVWKLFPNGTVEPVAGAVAGSTPTYALSIVASPATEVPLQDVEDLAAGPRGSLYGFTPNNFDEWFKLKQLGSISCIVNCNDLSDSFPSGFVGNGTSADALGYDMERNPYLTTPEESAVGPDDRLYLVDPQSLRVLVLQATFPSESTGNFFVSSRSGRSADEFNAFGQEVARYDTATWAPVLRFAYDSAGFLTSITDASGNVTTIQRDSLENPVSISSPFGQVTKLTSNSSQELTAITDPAGDAWQFKYDVNAYLV